MVNRFPVFAAHDEASCFNCGGDFGDGWHFQSGHAEGAGAWEQACEKCGMVTYYDINQPKGVSQ